MLKNETNIVLIFTAASIVLGAYFSNFDSRAISAVYIPVVFLVLQLFFKLYQLPRLKKLESNYGEAVFKRPPFYASTDGAFIVGLCEITAFF